MTGAIAIGEGPCAIAMGEGAGAIMDTGDGPGAIAIGEGPGAAGDIITGIADEAGDASITLDVGLGDASPTPIRARFELSISIGHGSRVKYETLR